MSLLNDLDAASPEDHCCGDLDAGVEGGRLDRLRLRGYTRRVDDDDRQADDKACMRASGWACEEKPDPPGEGWFRGIENWD